MQELEGELIVHQAPEKKDNSLVQFMEVAKVFAVSELVPSTYRLKPANCLVALEMAHRVGVSPMAVMQNLYVINGRPSWSAQYIIAAINSCGRFPNQLQYELSGEGPTRSCVAWAIRKDGTRVESPVVSIAMAKAEGWYSKKDRSGNEISKWPTMPDLMLRYRAASFFGRLYCPEFLFGMMSEEESEEIPAAPVPKTTKKAATAEVVETKPVEVAPVVVPPAPVATSQPAATATPPQAAAPTGQPATSQQVNELLWLKDGVPISDADWSNALSKRNVDDARKLTTEQADEMLAKLRAKVSADPALLAKFEALKKTRAAKPTEDVPVGETPPAPPADAAFEMKTADPAEAEPKNAAVAGKATKQQVEQMIGYRESLGITLPQWSAILAKKNVAYEGELSQNDADIFIANLEKKSQAKQASAEMKAWGEKVAPDQPGN